MQSQGLIISWPLEPGCQADKTGGLNSLVLSASKCKALTLHMKCTFSWPLRVSQLRSVIGFTGKQFWAADQRSKFRIVSAQRFCRLTLTMGYGPPQSALCLSTALSWPHWLHTLHSPSIVFPAENYARQSGANVRAVFMSPLPRC